jgi:hypothetical protein
VLSPRVLCVVSAACEAAAAGAGVVVVAGLVSAGVVALLTGFPPLAAVITV